MNTDLHGKDRIQSILTASPETIDLPVNSAPENAPNGPKWMDFGCERARLIKINRGDPAGGCTRTRSIKDMKIVETLSNKLGESYGFSLDCFPTTSGLYLWAFLNSPKYTDEIKDAVLQDLKKAVKSDRLPNSEKYITGNGITTTHIRYAIEKRAGISQGQPPRARPAVYTFDEFSDLERVILKEIENAPSKKEYWSVILGKAQSHVGNSARRFALNLL